MNNSLMHPFKHGIPSDGGIVVAFFNPNGIEAFSPGLRATSYPGSRDQMFTTLKRVESIPYVPFIKLHFVTTQQLPKFILKRNLPMMLFLPGDIIPHGSELRKADGENAIAVLPRKVLQARDLAFQPQR